MRPFRKSDIGKFRVIEKYYKGDSADPWSVVPSVLSREELVRILTYKAQCIANGSITSGHSDITFYQITKEMYERSTNQLDLPF